MNAGQEKERPEAEGKNRQAFVRLGIVFVGHQNNMPQEGICYTCEALQRETPPWANYRIKQH